VNNWEHLELCDADFHPMVLRKLSATRFLDCIILDFSNRFCDVRVGKSFGLFHQNLALAIHTT